MDRTAYKILEILALMATEGENLVVNKAEIISLIGVDITPEELDKTMQALEVNDMISTLYADDSMYCVSVRPKGKLIAEKNRMAEEAARAAAEEERARKEAAAAQPKVAHEQEDAFFPIVETKQSSPMDVKRFAAICAISSFMGGFVAAMITFLVTLFK